MFPKHIHELPTGQKIEYRMQLPGNPTILDVEYRELANDGSPHGDGWYPVSDSDWLRLQESGSDIVEHLADEHAYYWPKQKRAGACVS